MKTTFTFILLFIISISCKNRNEIPVQSRLTAKYVVFDDSISSKIVKNYISLEAFDKKNEDYKQPFKLDGKIYQFETEYKVGMDGKLTILQEHKYYSFNYSDFGIEKFIMTDKFKDTIGQTFSLKFSPSREQIIDCKDTLEIEKVYPKEKLIFVKRKRNDGRINIYEYN